MESKISELVDSNNNDLPKITESLPNSSSSSLSHFPKFLSHFSNIFFKKKKKEFDMDNLKKEISMDDHKLSIEQLEIRYNTSSINGLKKNQAEQILEENGPNILETPKEKGQILKFLETMFGGFALLLWIGAFLSFLAYGFEVIDNNEASKENIYLGIVLILVVVITNTFAYYQEYSSSKVMDSFKKLIPQSAIVIREGKQSQISAENVVVGDLVEIKLGDRLPADIRIVQASSFKVDNSPLTGESEAQTRNPSYTHENPLESKNLAFFSTNVVEGNARGIVIRTGNETMMGRIANLTTGIGEKTSPLTKEIQYLVHLIVFMSVIIALIFFFIALHYGYKWTECIGFLIGLVAGNIPEGLLTTITVMLTLTAKRMARKNCLVKDLKCVETLGSCSVICSDKTGTLTQNKMTVSHIWFDRIIFEADTSHNQLAAQYRIEMPSWEALSRVIILCNRAQFKEGQQKLSVLKRECTGDASETALLKFGELCVGGVEEMRKKNKKVCEIPFNSTNKYQISIHEVPLKQGPTNLLLIKGAPEKVWERCSFIMYHGNPVPLTPKNSESFYNTYRQLGGFGERVFGFAHLPLHLPEYPIGFPFDNEKLNFPVEGFCFLGLISMIDPPRPNVPDAVRKCREAGIKVVMVTGDHPITARAIAKMVGIISKNSKTIDELAEERKVPLQVLDPKLCKAALIHGTELKDLEQEKLLDILNTFPEIVFARTSPQQKLIIVEGFQKIGNVVAVTGDGVNDSPALKQANIGISMGITGSDVSKQAANIVLLDDNFATIISGIEEGRLTFENLKKTISYTLTHTLPEMMPFLLYIVLNMPLGVGAITVVFIDLGTDIIPAITLAYEKPEIDIMQRYPRKPSEKLVNDVLIGVAAFQNGMLETAGCIFSYFVIMAQNGFFPDLVIGGREEWENKANNNFRDSYGQEWTYAQRMIVQYTIYSSYFVGIVVQQWFNLFLCKTRRINLYQQGMINKILIGGIFLEALIAIFLVYCPGLQTPLQFFPVHWSWWICSFPFGLLLFFYGESLKLFIKFRPRGFVERELII